MPAVNNIYVIAEITVNLKVVNRFSFFVTLPAARRLTGMKPAIGYYSYTNRWLQPGMI